MVVTNRILLHSEYRVLAFCGGKGRSALLRKVAEELAKHNKSVLISSSDHQKLPLKGDVVIGRSIPMVLDALKKEFSDRAIVHLGKALSGQQMTGFNLRELQRIKSKLPADYFLIELGGNIEKFIYDVDIIRRWSKSHIWNQLIYCMEVSRIGHPVEKRLVQNFSKFRQNYPNVSSFSQNLLVSYLTDANKGIRTIFEQNWPALLFINGVNITQRENRAITLSRELKLHGIEHIALGNLQANLIKKLNFV